MNIWSYKALGIYCLVFIVIIAVQLSQMGGVEIVKPSIDFMVREGKVNPETGILEITSAYVGNEKTIKVGEKITIIADEIAPFQVVLNWHAVDDSIIKVNQEGVVEGLKEGRTKIKVSSYDKRLSRDYYITVVK